MGEITRSMTGSSKQNIYHLLIPFDLESTGTDFSMDDIIELAAHANLPMDVELRHHSPVYSSLVNTKKQIPTAVTELTGIQQEDLRLQPDLFTVLDEFTAWIAGVCCEVHCKLQCTVIPVLVAHSGLQTDFLMLLHGISKHPANRHVQTLQKLSLNFADSFQFVKQIRKFGFIPFHTKLSLINLVSEFADDQEAEYTAHRALADAQALARLLNSSKISKLIDGFLTKVGYEEMEKLYQHALRIRPQLHALRKQFAPGILDYGLDQHLVNNRITYQHLVQARFRCSNSSQFQQDVEYYYNFRLFPNQAEKIFEHLELYYPVNPLFMGAPFYTVSVCRPIIH